jgi:hypothetical protein
LCCLHKSCSSLLVISAMVAGLQETRQAPPRLGVRILGAVKRVHGVRCAPPGGHQQHTRASRVGLCNPLRPLWLAPAPCPVNSRRDASRQPVGWQGRPMLTYVVS